MNRIKLLQDRLFGELVILKVTGTSLNIYQGSYLLEYELPKTFQGYNYLNHAEEMAGWLQAILLEEKRRIRRCKIVLDTEQVFFQTVKLPTMTVREQQNWVYWEGSQIVPFEPGSYQAALLLWSEPVDIKDVRDTYTADTADLSAEWQEEEATLKNYLLIAISREIIEALLRFASFLKVKIEEITAVGPKQIVLPINLLPVVSKKEILIRRSYKTATVLCLLISLFLAVRSGIHWQHAKSAWQNAEQQLMPLRAIKAAYDESKQTDFRIRKYRQELQLINQNEAVWGRVLQTVGKTIPEGCWLDGLQQKQSKQLEIKGYAFDLARISEFLKNLDNSKVFSKVRIAESGDKRIVVNDREEHSIKVISFLFLAELAPVQGEGRP